MSNDQGRACRQAGQTLVELIVVITVGMLIAGALVFATITTTRNAQFARNQVQATKLAQEGLEKLRSIRDRDPTFAGLWNIDASASCTGTCYFRFNSSGSSTLLQGTNADFEDLGGRLQRQIQMQNGANSNEKIMTAKVQWTDFSGTHESRISTVLRKL